MKIILNLVNPENKSSRETCELAKEGYHVPAIQQHWLDLAQTNGLKVVVVLQS
jgi:hypothetical protein